MDGSAVTLGEEVFMKRFYGLFWCFCGALSVLAFYPSAHVNAQELWNSPKKGGSSSSSGRSYYNVPESSTASNRSVLYNTDRPVREVGGLRVVVQNYEDIRMRRLGDSAEWGDLSKSAKANRMADINHALRIEYKIKKASAKHMIDVFKQDKAARVAGEKEHQKAVADYEAEQEAIAEARSLKKEKALIQMASLRGRSSSLSYSSSSSPSSSPSYTTGKSSSSSCCGGGASLKNTERLFNDPND